jgi:Predicted DNA-binding protein with PD1-like DNA-binding motif
MSLIASSSNIKVHVIKFNEGEDIFEQIRIISKNNNIRAGFFFGLGSFKKLKLAYFNQQDKKYEEIEINKEVEITSLVGNISLESNEIFIHCHVNVGDRDSKVYGGHLLPESITFAGEAIIIEILDTNLERRYDPKTGLRSFK